MGERQINKLTKIVIMVMIVVVCVGFWVSCSRAEDNIIVSQVVELTCNFNLICESDLGEIYFNCPSDCEPIGPICNNNFICEPGIGETIASCPSDCEPVVVLCNSNGVCEPSLGETVSTCSSDCQAGGGSIHPEVVQEGLIGEPIEIFNIEVSTGIGATTISWETNKPTNATLIFGYGRSGDEEVYLDEFYTKKHSIRIDDLDFREEYFFKIFAEGIYGDNNFGYAELFIIRQSLPNQGGEETTKEEDGLAPTEGLIGSKTIETSKGKLEYPITPPIEGVCEDDTCGFESFGQFWGDFKCSIKKSVWFSFVLDYIWQILIFVGIIWLIFVLLPKKKKEEQ